MAAQVQQSLLAKKLGQKLTQAHKQFKDAPAEFGNARLPEGIDNGIAQLVDVKIGEYKDGENKGQPYFMAAGVVVEPRVHTNGMTIAGMRTQVGPIPLCDTPKSKAKKKTFAEHYADFINELKKLGVDTAHTDAQTPDAVESFLNAAITHLRTSKPHFKFRTWKGKATTEFPNPRTTEEWNGVCEYNGHVDPATNGVVDNTAALQPEPFTEPPQGNSEPTPAPVADDGEADPADVVAALLEVINADLEGTKEETIAAMQQLASMATAAGATEDQIKAASWDELAGMALGVFPEPPAPVADPVKGGVYNFRRRDSKGNPLKNAAGVEFPPQEIEVLAVDAAKKTCSAKTKDGKTIQAVGAKTPTAIKWEWLE